MEVAGCRRYRLHELELYTRRMCRSWLKGSGNYKMFTLISS